jgi:hypothetical protein
MILDLQSVYVPHVSEYKKPTFDSTPDPYRLVGDSVYTGSKDFGRLRFTSLAHMPFGRQSAGGIAEIVYYVHETVNDEFVLRRSDNLYPYEPAEPSGKDPALCRDVQELTFTYYDREGESFDKWDSDDESFDFATPHAVGIEIAFGKGEAARRLRTMVNLPVYRDKVG